MLGLGIVDTTNTSTMEVNGALVSPKRMCGQTMCHNSRDRWMMLLVILHWFIAIFNWYLSHQLWWGGYQPHLRTPKIERVRIHNRNNAEQSHSFLDICCCALLIVVYCTRE